MFDFNKDGEFGLDDLTHKVWGKIPVYVLLGVAVAVGYVVATSKATKGKLRKILRG